MSRVSNLGITWEGLKNEWRCKSLPTECKAEEQTNINWELDKLTDQGKTAHQKSLQGAREMKLLFKTFAFTFQDVKEGTANEGKVEGYASTFGNMDQGFDIVEKGAFSKTIRENKGRFPILADHNPSEQIGWNQDAHEDEKGLFVRGEVNLAVQKGVEKFALAKQALKFGAPTGLSIGYTTIQASPDSNNPRIRLLKELKLWEYSFVTFPMNTQAMLTTAKSIGAIDKALLLIQQLKLEGVTVRDFEMALQMEAAAVDEDPSKLGQSIDILIAKFKS